MDENLDLLLNETSKKQWVFFRLSEVYLNYAEAMNEAYGPAVAGSGSLNMTALQAINAVRTRPAVNISAVPAGTSQQNLRIKIQKERQVELAFEGHRYWDARRWMIANQVIGGEIRGVNITKNANGSFKYDPFVVEQRTWNDRLYYYPIPQTEITKSGGVILQNPNW